MKLVQKTLSVAVAAALVMPVAATAAEFELIGDDVSGFLSLSSVKATTDASIADSWDFPYYEDENGIFQSIAAVPLSEDSVYAEEALYTVLGKDITDAEFATLSAGTVSYDEGLLTGSGMEYISVTDLTLSINGRGFSPFHSGHNTTVGIGDFPFNYQIEASNLTGTGLTFLDGQLTSVDFDADIAVNTQLGELPYFLNPYEGSLSVTGDFYAFDLDVTQDTPSPLGDMTDTHMVFNRAGNISAVSAVPEPSVYAMFAGGLLIAGAFARRNRRS